MASLSFLISFKDETHIISVSKTEELVPYIREKFMISENSVCKLKVYNNDWNEWINVQPHELKGKEKLQLTIQETQPTTIPVSINWLDASSCSSRTSLLSETSFLHDIDNTAQHCDSDSTTHDIEEVLLDMPSSSHDTLSKPEPKEAVSLKRPLPEDSVPKEMSASDDSASDKGFPKDTPRREEVALKPWPRPFQTPVDSMPFSLLSSLQKGEFPSERQRRQLIQILFDKMAECERYPSKAQYGEVAEALVKKFPHLAQEIPGGTPYDYWKVKLVDKFRNERKFLVSAEKKEPVKKLKKSPSGHVLSTSNDAQLGEDEHSVEKHQSWMKQECQKKKPDQKKIRDLMELTFWHRRKMIISERTMVVTTLELYPALKDSYELQKEFERITGERALSASLKANLSEMSQKIMKIVEKKNREKVSKLNLGLHLAVAVNDSEKKDLEVAAAAFMLPVMFRTSDVIIKYESGEQRKGDGAPCLLWKGESPLTAESFLVRAEGEEFGQTENIFEGIATLTATYWTFDMAYPSKENSLFNFLEVALFKLRSSKPCRQTSNMLMKMKSL
ncbi:Sterile alpha motif domain-containing protein 3 [Holothuria leucospilota]|uniref:Sterile alpha motif domain-containing protein 3 n=1 Tax=Holothuria leucospilota TaxID=206669 RepID=A0A9Q0YAP2_HOLLE|nr:Sterile alpha motif domain-containing protein 3 [Holothuria leucospilota]